MKGIGTLVAVGVLVTMLSSVADRRAFASPAPTTTPQPAPPAIFPIYAPSRRPSQREPYPAAVRRAALAHLSALLGKPVATVAVTSGGYREVAIGAPCGAVRPGRAPANQGIGIGYELLVRVDTATYRYVARGGLGHYCGKQP